uniref:Uncharacterized protein n=1 Tax=Pasteurella multocida TaxID=747 RepID=A0A3G2CDD5_PASMD|nr:hypothetical protein [Pasteurella multocida]
MEIQTLLNFAVILKSRLSGVLVFLGAFAFLTVARNGDRA